MFRNITPVTKHLLIVNLIVFVYMALVPSEKSALLTQYGALHFVLSPDFRVWQPITSMFIHGGLTHFFFNMFALFMFGPQIEWALGKWRFLLYYMVCGVGAALVQQVVDAGMIAYLAQGMTFDQVKDLISLGAGAHIPYEWNAVAAQHIWSLANTPIVGASGAIYGVLLAFGMIFPDRRVMLMIPPIPLKAKWLVLGYGVLELALGLVNMSGLYGDGIAHFCHLGGMLFGLLLILYWKKKGTVNEYY
ncbi:MAG: rhomboid family intramembrane serine protease [Muribaculaceae bacterium]|nr:rhomboid family intramembrane serine protease [Muribaculaceae bacterium]